MYRQNNQKEEIEERKWYRWWI